MDGSAMRNIVWLSILAHGLCHVVMKLLDGYIVEQHGGSNNHS
jgi:hypothetical protein